MSSFIAEPARQTPLVFEADLCVVGGSCTGVFAAVRAARLGLRVALIESSSMLGGMAVTAQVNEWHSTWDAFSRERIIGGLTLELIERLKRRDAVIEAAMPSRWEFRFNSAEMAVGLDQLVRENNIRLFLNARCVSAVREENRLVAAIIEDKSGRRAIGARFFVDASGDGDLIRQAGFEAYKNDVLQPVNLQAIVQGYDGVAAEEVRLALENHSEEFGYPHANASPWLFAVPGTTTLRNVFGPRLNHVDASDADELTQTLLEARRTHRALCEMVEKQSGQKLALVNFAPTLGVRETWHARCLHQLKADELLNGEKFPDAIANGTYPVDVHTPEGTLLRFLDGGQQVIGRDGKGTWSRWREAEVTPPCYHVPLRSLIPRQAENLLVAGRLLDADREAFGGVRVMVNCNQMGEAAGVAAFVALDANGSVQDVEAERVREMLSAGGSVMV